MDHGTGGWSQRAAEDREVLDEYLDLQDRLEDETGEGIDLPVESAEEFTRVIAERHRQIDLWGTQRVNLAEWALILGEEYGEAIRAATPLHFRWSDLDRPEVLAQLWHLREELSHTAAVAVSWMEHLTEQIDALEGME